MKPHSLVFEHKQYRRDNERKRNEKQYIVHGLKSELVNYEGP